MAPFKLFNRKKNADKSITAGGQITRPGSTIIVQAPQRFGLDLSQFKSAILSAENVNYTQRSQLYDLYSEAILDPHLFSVMQKRKSAVLSVPIEFRRDGVPDDTINDNIKSPWFRRLVNDILDAQFWGFTLIQFNTSKDGWVDYFCVPRKHVDPQLELIKRYQSDITGVPFEEYPNLLMVRSEEPLGILARCVPYTIYKRGSFGDWATFSEIFGMPVREYIYDGADEESRQRTIQDAQNQAGASVFVHPDGTKMNFIEAGNKTGSSDVYDSFIDACNAELSKAVLGNTLTTEASETGTQALGTVHENVEERLAESDMRFVLDVLNYSMTDIFAKMGINTEGGEFAPVSLERMTASQKADLFKKAKDLGLPIDDDYIYRELNIEKPKDYDRMIRERDEKAKAAAAQFTNRSENFFDQAPDYGASKW